MLRRCYPLDFDPFFSTDVRQCWRVAKRLESGMVGINEGIIREEEAENLRLYALTKNGTIRHPATNP